MLGNVTFPAGLRIPNKDFHARRNYNKAHSAASQKPYNLYSIGIYVPSNNAKED